MVDPWLRLSSPRDSVGDEDPIERLRTTGMMQRRASASAFKPGFPQAREFGLHGRADSLLKPQVAIIVLIVYLTVIVAYFSSDDISMLYLSNAAAFVVALMTLLQTKD